MQNKKQFFSIGIRGIALLLTVFSIFYFSWTPDASLHSESYLPLWIVNWSNENFNLRTAVPFVLFGFLLEELSFLIVKINFKSNKFSHRKFYFGFSLFIVLVAEIGQFFCGRTPDIMDVFYGLLGSFIGALLYYLFRKLIQQIKLNAKQT